MTLIWICVGLLLGAFVYEIAKDVRSCLKYLERHGQWSRRELEGKPVRAFLLGLLVPTRD